MAKVFSISRHRINIDGPGVRTLVGLFGCNLSCRYCINPECKGASKTFSEISTEKMVHIIEKDEIYYKSSGGGVVFGGGEPLLQSDFIIEFCKLTDYKYDVGIETSLNIKKTHLEELIHFVNYWIVDIKDINNRIYRQYTGKNNDDVLTSLEFLIKNARGQIIVRVPLIPYYNTVEDNDRSIRILNDLGILQIERIKYIPIIYERQRSL